MPKELVSDRKLFEDVLAVSKYKPVGYIEYGILIDEGKYKGERKRTPKQLDHIPDDLVAALTSHKDVYLYVQDVHGPGKKTETTPDSKIIQTKIPISRAMVFHQPSLLKLMELNKELVFSMLGREGRPGEAITIEVVHEFVHALSTKQWKGSSKEGTFIEICFGNTILTPYSEQADSKPIEDSKPIKVTEDLLLVRKLYSLFTKTGDYEGDLFRFIQKLQNPPKVYKALQALQAIAGQEDIKINFFYSQIKSYYYDYLMGKIDLKQFKDSSIELFETDPLVSAAKLSVTGNLIHALINLLLAIFDISTGRFFSNQLPYRHDRVGEVIRSIRNLEKDDDNSANTPPTYTPSR